jgi:RNA polymerase sigma-70 factor, ECF subfamily
VAARTGWSRRFAAVKAAANDKALGMSSHPGHKEAPNFRTWFRENGGQLLQYASYVIEDTDLARDIAQEAAAKLFKAWPQEDQREKILTSPAYVRRIVVNCLIDHRKHRSRTNERESELVGELGDDARVDIESGLDVCEAVLHLSEDERYMLFQVYYQDRTIRTAGKELGIPESQAYRLHKRAKRNLAELLEQEED